MQNNVEWKLEVKNGWYILFLNGKLAFTTNKLDDVLLFIKVAHTLPTVLQL